MSKPIAFLSAAAAMLAASALPAAAADYYGGDDRPLSYHSQDDVTIDGGRARIEHRQDLRPAYGERRGPGPVVFDERRGPGPMVFDGRGPASGFEGYGEPIYRGRAPVERFGDRYDRPAAFAPRPYGGEAAYGFRDGYRPAAVAVGPAYGGGFGEPEGGCTVERSRSVTPGGWEKTVTHRTCYRR